MSSPLTLRRRALLLGAAAAALPLQRGRAADAPVDRRALPARSPYVGMNLSGLAYWTSEFPFADLVKNSGGWLPSMRGNGPAGTLRFTPDGYPAALEPGQSARLAVAWVGSGYATGTWVVRWDGEGEIGFPLTRARVVSHVPGRIELDVVPSREPMFVSIETTRPENPVRNLRFLWPGTEATHATQPFNPVFLERLAPFSGLRFMDWGVTNHSPLERWADRPTTAALSWVAPRGVPIETMLDLANTLQADPWLCVPHKADDDFIERHAALVKARLDPGLVATVEYSNEVWNRGFGQSKWALEQSKERGLPTPSGMGSAWYAERVRHIAETYGRVFGPAERRRWRVVVCAQAAWTKFAEEVLAWKDTASVVDALAIAPYFQAAAAADRKNVEATLALAPADLIEQMRASVRGKVKAMVVENAKLAARYKLRLDAYEAGTHDTTFWFPREKQDAATALFAAAHTDPVMREVYREYLETWIAVGGERLYHYNDISHGDKWGFWGALDRVTQDPATAPKYQGLLDTIAAHPAPPR
jgi:hypothetical protein